jgi:hypothetical protein
MNAPQREKLLQTLQARFEGQMQRHAGIAWADVQARLDSHPAALAALQQMESSGGEPDVIAVENGRVVFFDCSLQSPAGRRSACYDAEALATRKENKPANNALDMAAAIGIELLTEAQYRQLQQLGDFDTTTSSWIETPPDMRALGGALFCDRRYGRVFTYHNGAQSYYAARGFRGSLRV